MDLEDYRAFDAVCTGSGGSGATSSISPFRFTGQPLDFQLTDATGRPTLVLYHCRARGYEAYLGRWIQGDPALYQDSMNLYEYVKSNPVCSRDPTGASLALLMPVPEVEQADAEDAGISLGVLKLAQYVAGRAAAYSLSLSVAICTIQVTGTVDPAAGTAAWQEIVRFLKDGVSRPQGYQEGFYNSPNNPLDPEKWRQTLHHVLPKFLQGDPKGLTELLPKALHEKFHGELLRRLANAGLKLSGEPGATWEKFFEDATYGAERLQRAQEILLDYCAGV